MDGCASLIRSVSLFLELFLPVYIYLYSPVFVFFVSAPTLPTCLQTLFSWPSSYHLAPCISIGEISVTSQVHAATMAAIPRHLDVDEYVVGAAAQEIRPLMGQRRPGQATQPEPQRQRHGSTPVTTPAANSCQVTGCHTATMEDSASDTVGSYRMLDESTGQKILLNGEACPTTERESTKHK